MIVIKSFHELTTLELYEILKIRVNVFIIEQECIYPELDDIDYDAYHIFIKEDCQIKAYLRFFLKDDHTAQIGRVISCDRRKGYATKLLKETIQFIKTFPYESIYLEAQTYALDLYKNQGFIEISEEFLEDGIPHKRMERSL